MATNTISRGIRIAARLIIAFVAVVLVTIVIVLAFSAIKVNERIIEKKDEAGNLVRKTVYDTALGWSGITGLVLPIVLAGVFGLCLYLDSRVKSRYTKAGAYLALIVTLVILGVVMYVNVRGDLNWWLVLLGVFCAVGLILIIAGLTAWLVKGMKATIAAEIASSRRDRVATLEKFIRDHNLTVP